jgi:Lon protease-like protein
VNTLVPIFPLDVVLFPGSPLPLHIFESRYKEMISECLLKKIDFGVVRAEKEGVAQIGCTAEILAVTKTYDDGRMDIVARGQKRFELLEVNQDRPFLQAEILFVPDDAENPQPDQIEQAVKLHAEILALAGARQDLPETDEAPLSYHLAGSLPLDLDFKQSLLNMRSEAQRMQALAAYFETLLPNLRRAVVVRQRAGGNGHVN